MATRKEDGGRYSGGLVCLYNKNLLKINNVIKNDKFIIISISNLNLIIIFCYFNQQTDVKGALLEIDSLVCNIKSATSKILYCGDFNARVSNLNNLDDVLLSGTSCLCSRSSLDPVVNERGRLLLSFMEERGFFLLNGRAGLDSPANFTFVSVDR